MGNSQYTLIKIDIECSPQVEESVSEILSGIFGTLPFSVEDHETRKFVISTILTNKSALTSDNKKLLDKRLEQLKEFFPECGSLKIRYAYLRNKDWAESWKHHFKPLVFGKTLVVKPPWEKDFIIEGAKTVIIDPGLAFGTGNHPTTKFCLRQVVKYRPVKSPASFLDIGTGSGVLAIAAAKLGYSPITAFDFDPTAVEVAMKNAVKNRVAHKINLFAADVLKMDEKSDERYDLICANITDDILIQAVQKICSRLKENGKLAVAGILEKNFNSVLDAYTKAGLKLLTSKKEKEWKSGLFIKPE